MRPRHHESQISRRSVLTLIATTLVTPALARTAASNISVLWPWVRATWQHETKGYLTILNGNSFDDVLIHVGSSWAEKCTLQRAEWKGLNVTVREIGRLALPALSRTELKPGGVWIQIRLARAAIKGESMPLSLMFAKAGRIEVQALISNHMLGEPKDFPKN